MMDAVFAFPIAGNPISCEKLGHGHINKTYKIQTDAGRCYVLQRINTYVFRQPVKLMENVIAVTAFLSRRLEDPRGTLHFLQTREGKYYHVDKEGGYWRLYNFVEGFCLEAPQSPRDFYQSALAFGRFQNLLSDFPAQQLHETIPEFHNTVDRYRKLHEAMESNPEGRLSEVQQEIEFLLAREEMAGTLHRMRQAGELPLRVTHNDTKLNNVLLDPENRTSLCVLDLDTVMPGLAAYDYGDSIRFGAATGSEDEKNPGAMGVNLELFEAYSRGYLEACPSLTDLEVRTLPMGARIMTLELAVRFLTDYLLGDPYFGSQYPKRNLLRAQNQMALVESMERRWDEMNEALARVAAQLGR